MKVKRQASVGFVLLFFFFIIHDQTNFIECIVSARFNNMVYMVYMNIGGKIDYIYRILFIDDDVNEISATSVIILFFLSSSKQDD